MKYYYNKTIWITGASSGIGETLAKTLSYWNTKLILSSRSKEELQRVKNQCQNSENARVLPLDLAEHSKAGNWVNKAWKSFGSVDILINNGGIGQWGLSLETKSEVERKIFEVNYFGNVALSKAILPKMLERGSGQIAVVSSIAAKFGQSKLATYSASKAAVTLYYESLKEELYNSPVKIQVVSPGFIDTNVTLNSLTPDGSKLNKKSKAQKNGIPTKVFAHKMLKFMISKGFHKYIGKKELLAIPLHIVASRLFYRLIRR